MDNNVNTPAPEIDYGEQVRVRREKLKNLVAEGKNPYEQTKFPRTALAADILADLPAFEGKEVKIAGRIMSRRMMGKASFAHVLDPSAQIQIYVKIDNVGAEAYEAWKKRI